MRSLYVRPESADGLPAAPTAVEQGTPLADMVTWLAETYDSDRLDKAWSTVAAAALALVRPGPGVSIRLAAPTDPGLARSEEHTSELQSLMRTSYAVFCLKKKKNTAIHITQKTARTQRNNTSLNVPQEIHN